MKVHAKKGTGIIVGATIVEPCAGEMIPELAVAMQSKIGLGALGKIMYPYPTVADAICGCGVSYNCTVWKAVSSEEENATKSRKPLLQLHFSLQRRQRLPLFRLLCSKSIDAV